jgi:putative glutamine amidotransferase
MLTLDARFCDLVCEAGGHPVVIPPVEDGDVPQAVLRELDGVIFSGGDDVPPARYGAEPHPATVLLHARRVESDFRVATFVDERRLPVLAICAGIQQWNVHRGGTLHQHLPDRLAPVAIEHRHANGEGFTFHDVRLAPDSLVRSIMGADVIPVNSSHHQGLDRIGRGLQATAWAGDELVETVEDPQRPFCLGIQWHPEDMMDDPLQKRLFAALVHAARNR